MDHRKQVTREEAEAESAARATRLALVLVPLWRAARLWTAAVVLALFPVVFIVDDVVETSLSPVLPGMVVLVLLILGLPFLLAEVSSRRYRRKDLDWQGKRAVRSAHNARSALVLAAVWVVVWFAVLT